MIEIEVPRIPSRAPDGHKGSFGTVGVLGGCMTAERMMIGGPAFAALGALRAGAGLAMVAAPEALLPHVLGVCPSAVGLPLPQGPDGTLLPSACAERLDSVRGAFAAFVIGPALGTGHAISQITIRLVADSERPLIIDADGLNALAALSDYPADLRAPCILTPHPGEFRRLTSAIGLDGGGRGDDARATSAERLARRLGAIVVLKGARTVVTDGHRTHVSSVICEALATAGTGDVLAGVIAGLVAQHHDRADGRQGLDLFACAVHGVEVHGAAALRIGRAGLLAAELAEAVADVMAERRRGD